MDVLSAAMEAAAAADAASSSASSSAASSPRPGSPANSTSTKDGTAGGGGGSGDTTNKTAAEMHEARVMVVASAAASLEGGGAAVPAVSQAIRDAHAALEAQALDIRNGKHPKQLAEKEMQERLKCRRLDAAHETRQLLITNLEELREAEFRDSDVQTKVHLERTQEELLDDVHQRIRKAKVDGGIASPKPGAVTGIAATGAAGGTDADKQAATGLLIGKKRARLMPTRSFEKVTPEAVLAKAEAKRIQTVTLSDIEMRTDFQAIISDWRERATKYLSTYNNSHWTKVNVCPDSFRVRGVTFSKGDPVVVTSRVTGEEFHGEITVVKPKAVFLSLYGGVKTRIFVDHISTGRLTVARADAKSVQ